MEEILHHLGLKIPANNGMNYLSSGAGFLPSTAWTHFLQHGFILVVYPSYLEMCFQNCVTNNEVCCKAPL